MGHAKYIALLLVAGFLAAGCQPTGEAAYDRRKIGPSAEPVISASQALGGLPAWRSHGKLSAEALVTTYSTDGKKYVSNEHLIIDAVGGHIAARARTPLGEWSASYSRGGSFSLRGAEALESITREELRDDLAVILHRTGGPLNIVLGRDQAGPGEKVWIDGQNLLRVPVTVGDGQAAAYYFDPTTGLLKMVTSGGDAAGQKGTVTIYTYQLLSSGLTVPKTLRVVNIGEHVLVGSSPSLEVDFTKVTSSNRGWF